MRIVRFELDGAVRAGVVGDGDVVLVAPEGTTTLDLLTLAPEERARVIGAGGARPPLSEVRLLAPLEPVSIRDFSVFEQHIEGAIKTTAPDAGVPEEWYQSPVCYFSNPHAITGPGDDIEVPPGCHALDLELEVAAVIGKPGRNVRLEAAGSHIAGYTIFNDWSARDLGGRELKLPFGQCKGKDFANTLGPWIVTPDELERYRDGDRLDLEATARVNGVALGTDTLANMAWSFEELVVYAARGAWIKPGDVLGTGTVGFGCFLELWGNNGRQDPPPLAPGDVVDLTVQGIGTLTNRVVAGVPGVPLPPARPGSRRHRARQAAGTGADDPPVSAVASMPANDPALSTRGGVRCVG